jgi:hypothetical protein
MKKILLFLPFIACACTQQEVIQRVRAPSETSINEKCAEIQKYKIFQVMNDGALAFACETQYGVETCLGLVAYIPKKKGQIYYDDMIIEPPSGQCITYAGVYRYAIKNGLYKTVPKLKLITE